jgi:predicted metal-dependent hydrolase
VRIAVSGGRVVVTAPPRVSHGQLDRMIMDHRDWIERVIHKHKKLTDGVFLEKDIFDKKEFAYLVKDLVEKQYATIASAYGVKLGKISVKKMRSRWGSCSGRGNISINLLLGHLPEELLRYVIIHELCHLVHHNHSQRFWSLVAAHAPGYKTQKMALRRYSHFLMVGDMPRDADADMIK